MTLKPKTSRPKPGVTPKPKPARKRKPPPPKPSQAAQEAAIRARLRSRYDLTLEEYEALKTAQGGVCAICKEPPEAKRRLHIDHDHNTGVVRALLCRRCNLGIGSFGDNPLLLTACVKYLRKHGR